MINHKEMAFLMVLALFTNCFYKIQFPNSPDWIFIVGSFIFMIEFIIELKKI